MLNQSTVNAVASVWENLFIEVEKNIELPKHLNKEDFTFEHKMSSANGKHAYEVTMTEKSARVSRTTTHTQRLEASNMLALFKVVAGYYEIDLEKVSA